MFSLVCIGAACYWVARKKKKRIARNAEPVRWSPGSHGFLAPTTGTRTGFDFNLDSAGGTVVRTSAPRRCLRSGVREIALNRPYRRF
jgi:hypothetical protein